VSFEPGPLKMGKKFSGKWQQLRKIAPSGREPEF
jgi:hypothetical protein